MSRAQTLEELQSHLSHEIDFIVDAAAHYDRGQAHYAKQIATSIRKLVHDTPQSHSLLTQLGLKEAWRWRDTGEEIDPANLLATFGLVKLTVSWDGQGGASVTTFEPWLDEYPRSELHRVSAFSQTPISRQRGTVLAFSRWWNRPVMKDFGGNPFARSDFVLKVANQDGGAHIDPRVSGAYVDLSRQGSLSLPVEEDDASMTLSVESPVPATLRQIAFEVVQTFEHYRPDLV